MSLSYFPVGRRDYPVRLHEIREEPTTLTPEIARRLMRAASMDTKAIADRYSIRESQVWNILARGDGEVA